jgi:anti-anti-sigma regulatory factor
MGDLNNSLNTSAKVVNECLIVTLPNYIADDDIQIGINRILIRVCKSSIKGVILDLSMISALDSYGFNILERAAKTISLMGVAVVWVGLSPGIVSSLLDLNLDLSHIKAAVDLEQGISIILDVHD